jgi:hypothetical protein
VSQVVIWASDRRGCAGAVIDVVDDTHVFTPAELENPDWLTLRVSPDLTRSEIAALCTRQTPHVQSRVVYRIETADLPVATITPIDKAAFLARLREVV